MSKNIMYNNTDFFILGKKPIPVFVCYLLYCIFNFTNEMYKMDANFSWLKTWRNIKSILRRNYIGHHHNNEPLIKMFLRLHFTMCFQNIFSRNQSIPYNNILYSDLLYFFSFCTRICVFRNGIIKHLII